MYIWKLLSVLILVLVLGACTTPRPNQTILEPEANYWQQLGSSVAAGGNASFAQTNSGISVIAYSAYDGTSYNIYAKRWDGSNWVQLGTTLDLITGQHANNPSLALDSSGNPTISWYEWGGASFLYNIYVKRWNGSSWVQLGTALDVNTNSSAYYPSLALDNSGNPVVSWVESDGPSDNIYVKRWNGSNWVQLGGFLDANIDQNAYNPRLALDGAGNPVVSWHEDDGSNYNIYVKRWDGSSWVPLGGEIDMFNGFNAVESSLALDSSGNPVVAWREWNGTSDNIYVKRWVSDVGWVSLGSSLNWITNLTAYSPSLALDSLGNPSVSWQECANPNPCNASSNWNIYVKQWNGSTWNLVGNNPMDTSLANSSFYPSLSLVNGNLSVAWQEGNGNISTINDSIYVKRFVTNSWQDIDGILDVAGGQSALSSSVTRFPSNIPIVAWDETDSNNGSRNVYVKVRYSNGWTLQGGALDRVIGADAENPSVALRTTNIIHVAWQENGNIYEKFFNGTTWVTQGASGGALDTVLANEAITPSLAIKTTNLPVVAFAENGDILVKQLVGTTWTAIGTALDTSLANEAYRPSLALKTDNNPIVAWYEDIGTSFNIYAKEWNGTAWIALGTTIDKTVTRDAKDIVLAIRSDNRPVVAWEEAGSIYVKRWNGTSWVAVGGTVDKTASNEALRPALDLRTDNNPVVSWQEWNGSSYDVFAKRWTGSTWVQITSTVVDKNLSRNAERPALILKSDNNPIVSWDEEDGISDNIYVRQF
jgi:hypothetical protein